MALPLFSWAAQATIHAPLKKTAPGLPPRPFQIAIKAMRVPTAKTFPQKKTKCLKRRILWFIKTRTLSFSKAKHFLSILCAEHGKSRPKGRLFHTERDADQNFPS